MSNNTNGACAAGVNTFVRNRYFYGKLLDVMHFELEQNYGNAKRWLINRLVLGYGVVCGLNVELCADKASVVVLPGVAIDKWGREIVVPAKSPPVPLPAAVGTASVTECDDPDWFHLLLCFHECPSDPAPALGGDCDQNAICSPGAIRERYSLSFTQGKLPPVNTNCQLGDLISDGAINYAALVDYVSAPCAPCPDDPCISLANVRVAQPGAKPPLDQVEIDIGIRPIVYTNDLLHDLLVCLTNLPAETEHPRGGKN